MPKEVRYLLFSNEELYQALVADLREHAQSLPQGNLKNIHVGASDKPSIALVHVTEQGVESTIRFENHEVLRAMIAHCGARKIPLSAKAAKTLEFKDGTVGMLCTLNVSLKATALGSQRNTHSGRHATKPATATSTVAKAAFPA